MVAGRRVSTAGWLGYAAAARCALAAAVLRCGDGDGEGRGGRRVVRRGLGRV